MRERLRAVQARLVGPVARRLLRMGIHPDAVTWFGTIAVTVTALVCFGAGWLWQGTIAVAVLACSDMLDGQMARESGQPSRWGSFLDSSLDRIADAGVLGGLAWHLGVRVGAEWAAVAVAALVTAQLTSYVKARAEAVGCRADVGLIARADRIVLALLGALLAGLGVPYALEAAMLLLLVGGSVTVLQRLITVRRQLPTPGTGGTPQPPGVQA